MEGMKVNGMSVGMESNCGVSLYPIVSGSPTEAVAPDLGIDSRPFINRCAKLNEDEESQCPAPQVGVGPRSSFNIASFLGDPVEKFDHDKVAEARAHARLQRWQAAANMAPPALNSPELNIIGQTHSNALSTPVGKPFRPFAPLSRISAPLFGGSWHCATPMPSPSHDNCSDSFSVDLHPHVPKMTGNWSVGGPPSDSDFSCIDPIPYQHPRLSTGNWKTYTDVHGEDIAAREKSSQIHHKTCNAISPNEHKIMESILAEAPLDMSNLGFIHSVNTVHPNLFAYDSGDSTESSSSSEDEDIVEPSKVNSVVEPLVAGPSRPKPPPIKINVWTQEDLAIFDEVEIQLEEERLEKEAHARRRCTRTKGEELATGLVFAKKTRKRKQPQERASCITGCSRKGQFVKKHKK
ncbi:unnamed protein product [Allacma fusca]|uniref:Uncharacterized protein n=1 Tax=Allacma fusca TaxID=39272 RepID=A0A8J2PIR5_9HEXA|nr:unnamed protein product [Allacma fusca]